MMFNSPLASAVVAGIATLVFGLALSRLAIRLRWIERTVWLAAVVVPLAVAAFVYLTLR
jgi:hypothetical protein